MAEERTSDSAAAGRAGTSERRLRRSPLIGRALKPQEMFAIVGGYGLLALLITDIMIGEAIPVHPVFPLAALIFFLHPFRLLVVPRRIMQLGIAVFVLWFFFSLSGALLPFTIALIIAYILSPIVTRMERHGIRRWTTSLVLVLAILGLYAVIGVFVVPRIVEQGRELLASAASLLHDTRSILDRERLVNWLAELGVDRAEARDIVVNTIEPQVRAGFEWLVQQTGSIAKNIASLLEGILNLILIPVLTFYFLNDFDRIKRFARSTILQGNERHVAIARKADEILSSYLRGIVTTSSMVGVAAVIVLTILDVPYAGLLGSLTGIFNLIPTLGMFLNLGVAMIVFLFSDGDWLRNTAIMAVTIAGLHAVNAYMVEPRVIGHRVGLHPVVLIASLFVFGYFLGFVGLVIAVPTTAVLQMLAREWYERNSVVIERNPTGTAG